MPELPEVETVRRGLDAQVVGSTVTAVQVRGSRTLRRHLAGPADFADRLRGCRLAAARRRGKFLWLPLAVPAGPTAAQPGGDGLALLAHLGMSGQFRIARPGEPDQAHLHVRMTLDGGERELRFVDQRTFGGLSLTDDGDPVPPALAHLAPDPLEPAFDDVAFNRALRRRRTGVKRALLDQTLISGVGNIYADEALWRARMHWARPTDSLRARDVAVLLAQVRAVLADAIDAGGTSFDALYVAVNGESGWFDRALAAYGRVGEPCPRCGRPIVRERFANRSSYRCRGCQRTPRQVRR